MNIDLGELEKILVQPYISSKGKWEQISIHLDFTYQKNVYFHLNRKEAKKLIKDMNKWLDKEE